VKYRRGVTDIQPATTDITAGRTDRPCRGHGSRNDATNAFASDADEQRAKAHAVANHGRKRELAAYPHWILADG